jgi:hypothetical protein
MSKIYTSSYGKIEQSINGKPICEREYATNSDGKNIEIQVKVNPPEELEKLDDTSLMELLNCPTSDMSLIQQLEKNFPLNKPAVSKTKKREKTKAKKTKVKKTKAKKIKAKKTSRKKEKRIKK